MIAGSTDFMLQSAKIIKSSDMSHVPRQLFQFSISHGLRSMRSLESLNLQTCVKGMGLN
jgi:hypothetical protein